MRKNMAVLVSAFACALLLSGGFAVAADQTRDKDQLHTQDKDKIQDQDRDRTRLQDDQIYGKQLMTQQELNQYRAKVQAAKTKQERSRIESQHRAEMQSRAKSRGVSMPDDTPGGKGMAPGGGGAPGSGGSGGRGG